jgi:hypothetical protein
MNGEICRRVGKEGTLWNTLEKRRTRWIGHTLRQWIHKECNRRKYRGNSSKRRAKGQIKKRAHRKICQEVSQLALDRVRWRAAVYPLQD